MSKDLAAKGSVVIGWLMGGQSTPGFVGSIAALTAVTPQYGVKLLGAIPKVSGPRIAAARNNLVSAFLSTDADWLFMVDDDMTFDSDVLVKMLEIADVDKVPVLGGFAYAAGRDGYFSTIWTVNEDNEPVRVEDYPAGELIRVVGTGAACLLVHRKVFEGIAENHGDSPWPWFQETAYNGNTVGEDFTFCLRVGEAGFPVHVHTGIEFGHEKIVNINRSFVEMWRKAHRVIVTGTGRCGTGYVARVLQRAAIPATHEAVYGPRGDDWAAQRVEASWMAAPYLPIEAKIIHLVRHPLDVINSWLGIQWFTDERHTEYLRYMTEHVDLQGLEPVEAAMKAYVEWNKMIEPWAMWRHRVEDLGPEDFSVLAYEAGARHAPHDFADALAAVPTNFNGRPRASLTWDDLPAGEWKVALEKMAKEYGYDV